VKEQSDRLSLLHNLPINDQVSIEFIDMSDRDRMDTELPLVREARDRNDEILERIYIGRRCKKGVK
jgi:hypothetical protein